MVQSLFGFGMGAKGIVGTLILTGILLHMLNISSNTAKTAINSGIGLGLIFGFLGVFMIVKRLIG